LKPFLEGHGLGNMEFAKILEIGALLKLSDGSRGRPSTEYWLTEEQVITICFFARTERAAAVRKRVREAGPSTPQVDEVTKGAAAALLSFLAAAHLGVHLHRRTRCRLSRLGRPAKLWEDSRKRMEVLVR
jgi:hypothetical protein